MFKHIKLLCLPLALASCLAQGKAYIKQDIASILEQENGRYAISFTVSENIKNKIGEYAANYPTTFDSDEDKKLAAQDATALAALLTQILEDKVIAPESEHYRLALHQIAQLAWYAHNMDVENAAAVANQQYQALLEHSPAAELPAIKAEYGGFLASSGKIADAIEMMQAALNEGYSAVEKHLGMAYLAQGKQAQALEHLRRYQKNFSEDKEVGIFIEAVETGNVKLMTKP